MAKGKARKSAVRSGKADTSDQRARERAIYASASVIMLIAAAATFWKGRTVYRHIYMHQTGASLEDLIVILVSISVIQIAFWSVLDAPPPFAIRKNVFFASFVLFLSRISFMLAGALFSIVVLVRFEELDIRPRALLVFVAVLFTIYCFSKWIERLGHALEHGSDGHTG
ncbi:hypothetical protein IZ6_17240 [Terrihabitans soli]|uniref:Uncharacterized protein n=1 Tax=Terrihabitans soli TaxID=708113 RepID=A0A6S6QPR1_9HYPH|nr:hypothetical protein [Terrihabitans soli]BCJ90989.1 hypothetical protein IZ6_17240 [Terrihabitans soli]